MEPRFPTDPDREFIRVTPKPMLLGLTIFFFILLFSILDAHSADLEVSVGPNRYSERENGVWYYDKYATSNHRNSRAWQIGLHGQLENSGVGFRVAYVSLGRIKTDSYAMPDADEGHDPAACNPTTGRDCLSRYKGKGGAYGLTFSPTLTSVPWHGVTLQAEAGPFIFKSWWDETVSPTFSGTGGLCPTEGCDYVYNHGTGVHVTWFGGYQIKWHGFFIMGRAYHNVFAQGPAPKGGDVGYMGKWDRTLQFGYSFSF